MSRVEGTAQILLRCMGVTGSSPGQIVEFPIPYEIGRSVATQIVGIDGKLHVRQEHTSTKSVGQVVARLLTSPPSFLFEPRVPGISIEPPPSEHFALHIESAIELPPGNDIEHHYTHLRSGDTINFSQHDCKIQLSVESRQEPRASAVPKMPSLDYLATVSESEDDSPAIQVKSSGTEMGSEVCDDDTTDSEAEDDIKDTTDATIQREDTPPTELTTNGEIKETPAQPTTNDHISAAMDQSSGAKAAFIDPNSPLASKSESQARLVAAIEDTGNPLSDGASEELGDDDYIAVAARPSEAPNTDADDDAIVEDHTVAMLTSEGLDEHGSAQEAATRSITQGRKRKNAEAVDEDVTEPAKKRTPGDHSAATEQHPRSKGARKQSEGSAEDEIVVATSRRDKGKKASSPQVVIPVGVPPAGQSTSPATSVIAVATDRPSKVVFSSTEQPEATKWLKLHGVAVIDEIPARSNFVCVVPGGRLKTTAKVLRSLAMGKLVVTEMWVTDSQQQGKVLSPNEYIHKTVEDTIDVDRATLFRGYTCYCTKKLVADYGKRGWESVTKLLKEAGANLVEKGSAYNGETAAQRGKTLFFGSETEDPDAEELAANGHTVYSKDMLTQSIVDAEINPDENQLRFVIKNGAAKKGKKRR